MTPRPLVRLLAGAVVTLATARCASPPGEDVGDGRAAHGEGPALRNDAFLWIETDEASFEAHGSTMFGAGSPLHATDPIAVRLQGWLDRLHAAAASSTRERTGEELLAPAPVALVRDARVPNAWVSPLVGCAGGPVDWTSIPGRPPASGAADPALVAIGGRDAVRVRAACVPATNWPASGAGAFLTSLGGTCTYEERPDGVHVRGDRCSVTSATSHATQLAIEGASHFIGVTTKLVEALDDEVGAAFMLAHELAHYYRAHPSRLDTFDYWYVQESPPRPGKPTPIPDSAEFEARFRKHGRRPLLLVDGETTAPRLRTSLVRLGHALATRTDLVPPACGELATALAADFAGPLLNNRPLTEAQRGAYLAFHGTLLACADGVLISTSGAPGTIPPNTSGLDASDGAALEGKTLREAITLADGLARARDAEALALLEELNQRRLGHYTYEQEADEVAMELAVRAGIAPERVLEGWLALMVALSADPASKQYFEGDPVTVSDCAALFRAGWTRPGPEGAPEPVVVPLGEGSHHGFCYRLFNLSREAEAHAYVPRPAPPAWPVPWSDIRELARARLAAMTTGLVPAPPPPPPEDPGDPMPIVDPF